jgi:hypothetical protein
MNEGTSEQRSNDNFKSIVTLLAATSFGDDHRTCSIALPQQHINRGCMITQRHEICFRDELTVDDTLTEREPFALILPELNLINDDRREDG